MKQTILNCVKISKVTSCLSYALERVGLSIPELKDSKDIENFFTKTEIPDDSLINLENSGLLNIGDLLLFTKNERTDIVPMEILENGTILSKPTVILRHIAVYEGNDMFSDCGVSSKNYPFCKHLRMRKYSETSSQDQPTHILKLKLL